MTSLNISNNSLGGLIWVDGWAPYNGKQFKFSRNVTGNYEFENELPEGLPKQVSGIAPLADAIKDMRAMSSLDLSSNRIGGCHEHYDDQGGFGKYTATPEGPKAIAVAIKDMGALLSLDMSNNSLNGWSGRGMDCLGPAVASSTITSLNIANNSLSQNGGIDAVVSMLDKRALIKLDISKNRIGAVQKQNLQRICMAGGIKLSK
jgi:hypothetical protein